MNLELLWFDGCPNHTAARELLLDVVRQKGVDVELIDIDVSDPGLAQHHKFPGSPTIRVNGRDVEPGFQDSGDYTPRCRLYLTEMGPKGVPERAWIESAIEQARA